MTRETFQIPEKGPVVGKRVSFVVEGKRYVGTIEDDDLADAVFIRDDDGELHLVELKDIEQKV